MWEIILAIIAFICLILGCLGTFLPLLPGILLSLLGMVLYKLSTYASYGWNSVVVVLVIVLLAMIADYLIPLYGVKKMGGTKYGIYGSIIGLLIGIFLSPFGGFSLLLCPFIGAFAGEWFKQEDKKQAFKAAMGSFIGFLLTTGINLAISFAIFIFCVKDASHWFGYK